MMSQLVKVNAIKSNRERIFDSFVSCQMKVLEKLDLTFPGVYTEKNVLLSATHTHSVPAGFMQYFTFNITNLGFIQQNFDVLVGGITKSILKAHDSLAPGRYSRTVSFTLLCLLLL